MTNIQLEAEIEHLLELISELREKIDNLTKKVNIKEIKIGDVFIGKNEIFKVVNNLSWDGKRLYSCDTWIEGEGFIDNSDYDIFTDQHIEDYGFEIYSPK